MVPKTKEKIQTRINNKPEYLMIINSWQHKIIVMSIIHIAANTPAGSSLLIYFHDRRSRMMSSVAMRNVISGYSYYTCFLFRSLTKMVQAGRNKPSRKAPKITFFFTGALCSFTPRGGAMTRISLFMALAI